MNKTANVIFATQGFSPSQGDTITNTWKTGKTSSKGRMVNGFEWGVWKYWNKAGVLEQETQFKRGKVEGRVTYFYPNGKKKNEGFFHNSNQDSSFTEWYTSGNIKEKGLYKKGDKKGLWITFNEDSSKQKELKYISKDSVLLLNFWDSNKKQLVVNGNGSYIEYSPSGKIEEKGFYKNGLQDGLWEFYYENGNTRAKGSFSKGERSGVWTMFYESGAKSE